jgi:hypothetical protein
MCSTSSAWVPAHTGNARTKFLGKILRIARADYELAILPPIFPPPPRADGKLAHVALEPRQKRFTRRSVSSP